MTSPVDDRAAGEAPDRGTRGDELHRLRTRLYAPDATAADHERYAAALAARGRAPRDPARAAEDEPAGRAVGTAPRERGPLLRVVVVGAAALASGLVIGALVTSAATGPARPPVRPTPPPRTAVLPVAPQPIAAASLGGTARERADRTRALAQALRLPDGTARTQAMVTVASSADRLADRAWARRNRCVERVGTGGLSRAGRPGGLEDVHERPGSNPVGTRFRLKVYLAEPTSWSWVAHGRTGDGSATTVALGAGGAEAGAAQYAEFDTDSPVDLTSVDVRADRSVPFLWAISACTPG